MRPALACRGCASCWILHCSSPPCAVLHPTSPPIDDSASKAVIRSVCVILDAFHFPLPSELDEAQLAAEAAEAAALAAQEAAAEQLAAAEAAAAAEDAAEKKKNKQKKTEEGEAAEEAAGEAEEAVDEEELPDAAAIGEVAMQDADVVAAPAQQAVPAGEVYRMLAKRVVPELQRIMVDKETVRAPVALAGAWLRGQPWHVRAGWWSLEHTHSALVCVWLSSSSCPVACTPPTQSAPANAPSPAPLSAVVKVLQLLPEAAMRFQLPRTLQKVANLLRVRMQSTR